MKSVLRSGSSPAAIQSAALSSALATIAGGVGVVAGQRMPVGDEVRSSRSDPAATTQFWSAPTRWPRWSLPVGRMPDTMRCFTAAAASRGSMKGGPMIFADEPGEHQRVEDDEAVRPHRRVEAIGRPRRQQVRQHVAAVERRNRDHVEERQQQVDAQRLHASGTGSGCATSSCAAAAEPRGAGQRAQRERRPRAPARRC